MLTNRLVVWNPEIQLVLSCGDDAKRTNRDILHNAVPGSFQSAGISGLCDLARRQSAGGVRSWLISFFDSAPPDPQESGFLRRAIADHNH